MTTFEPKLVKTLPTTPVSSRLIWSGNFQQDPISDRMTLDYRFCDDLVYVTIPGQVTNFKYRVCGDDGTTIAAEIAYTGFNPYKETTQTSAVTDTPHSSELSVDGFSGNSNYAPVSCLLTKEDTVKGHNIQESSFCFKRIPYTTYFVEVHTIDTDKSLFKIIPAESQKTDKSDKIDDIPVTEKPMDVATYFMKYGEVVSGPYGTFSEYKKIHPILLKKYQEKENTVTETQIPVPKVNEITEDTPKTGIFDNPNHPSFDYDKFVKIVEKNNRLHKKQFEKGHVVIDIDDDDESNYVLSAKDPVVNTTPQMMTSTVCGNIGEDTEIKTCDVPNDNIKWRWNPCDRNFTPSTKSLKSQFDEWEKERKIKMEQKKEVDTKKEENIEYIDDYIKARREGLKNQFMRRRFASNLRNKKRFEL